MIRFDFVKPDVPHERVPLIVYDNECPFCQRSVRFLDKILTHTFHLGRRSEFMECPYSSSVYNSRNIPDSLLLIEHHAVYSGWDAVIRICMNSRLRLPAAIISRIIPSSVGNKVYNFIARRRKKINNKDHSCIFFPFKNMQPMENWNQ